MHVHLSLSRLVVPSPRLVALGLGKRAAPSLQLVPPPSLSPLPAATVATTSSGAGYLSAEESTVDACDTIGGSHWPLVVFGYLFSVAVVAATALVLLSPSVPIGSTSGWAFVRKWYDLHCRHDAAWREGGRGGNGEDA